MDSSRFWNTIRSPEDFKRTRDFWNLGSMRVVDYVPGQYHYAMGDATNAYSRKKLKRLTREILYVPAQDVLFVFDRVVITQPSFKKAWLLHGVNEPGVGQDVGQGIPEAREFKNASNFRFQEGSGELLVHSLLPRERLITRRGDAGMISTLQATTVAVLGEPARIGLWNFKKAACCRWTRSFSTCGRLFGGRLLQDFHFESHKRGAWRVAHRSLADHSRSGRLLSSRLRNRRRWHRGKKRTELIDGVNSLGAASEAGPYVLFNTSDTASHGGEATLPDVACDSLIVIGLLPHAVYELSFTGPNV